MTAVPAPLASAGADVRAPAPITSAGVATPAAGWIPPRLSADSLRPYVGILGVLIGAILSFVGSRITTFGLADLRGGLHFGFDEGAWMTTSFGVGQMMIGVACPYLGAISASDGSFCTEWRSCSSPPYSDRCRPISPPS